jgi:hypothetical protein
MEYYRTRINLLTLLTSKKYFRVTKIKVNIPCLKLVNKFLTAPFLKKARTFQFFKTLTTGSEAERK